LNARKQGQQHFAVTPRQALAVQAALRTQIVVHNEFDRIDSVAGADVSLDPKRGLGFAGVVVFRFPRLDEIERVGVHGRIEFPYVPGLLSFREGPLLLEAFSRLSHSPDLLMFDGQGLAHPRRLGIASHLSLLLNKPGIGVAKSRLIGTHREPARRAGTWTRLYDGDEVIGAVVRTRTDVKPVFVSVGHRIDLATAVRTALACTDGTRIPKPTREADRFVGELKRAALARRR